MGEQILNGKTMGGRRRKEISMYEANIVLLVACLNQANSGDIKPTPSAFWVSDPQDSFFGDQLVFFGVVLNNSHT